MPLCCNYLEKWARKFGFEIVGRLCGVLSGQIGVVSPGSSLCVLDKAWGDWK